MKSVIYIASPVSTGGAGSVVANAKRAIRWTKWFVEQDPTRIYIAPWVAEVLGFLDTEVAPEFYQRVLDDDCEVVRRLDGVVGVGFGGTGGWSRGMAQERATARAVNLDVLDMTWFAEPADVPKEFSLNLAWSKAQFPGRYA